MRLKGTGYLDIDGEYGVLAHPPCQSPKKSNLQSRKQQQEAVELPTGCATRLVSDRLCILRSGQRDKSRVISSVEWSQTAFLTERKHVMIEATTDQEKIGQALRWVVSLLTRYEIPYQICGGMAAKAYGVTRPLVDIDFYAALQESPHFQEFLKEIHPYLIREWSPHLSASWDIIYLALN